MLTNEELKISLRKAEGSEVLKSVYLGKLSADVICLKAVARLDELERSTTVKISDTAASLIKTWRNNGIDELVKRLDELAKNGD